MRPQDAPNLESPGEKAERAFYTSLQEEPGGALVISNGAGNVFWVSCNLCLGDERRKAPRRYADKSEAQAAADEHMRFSHRGER